MSSVAGAPPARREENDTEGLKSTRPGAPAAAAVSQKRKGGV